MYVALPAIMLFREADFRASTTRTGHAVRPAPNHNIVAAVGGIGEVNDCILKCSRFHAVILAGTLGVVKYILALRRAEGIKHRPLAGANLPRRQAILSQSVGTNDDPGAQARWRRYLVGLWLSIVRHALIPLSVLAAPFADSHLSTSSTT